LRVSEVAYTVFLNLLVVSLLFLGVPVSAVEADEPYLQCVAEFYLCPVLAQDPYGKLNVIVTVSKLMNDWSDYYDWYFYGASPVGDPGISIQAVPGIVAYNSDYVTAYFDSNFYVKDWLGWVRELSDYGPNATDGYSTSNATANVTLSGGYGDYKYNQSYSYDIPYVKVENYSDFSEHSARWRHDVNEADDNEDTSECAYSAMPSFVVRVLEDNMVYAQVDFIVRWARCDLLWGWYGTDTCTGTYYIDAGMCGN
jgi:hypothetical protein